MKSSIVLHADMGKAVVDRLREFGKLPKRGIVAGQAVDSALTDLFGQGGGCYNDIDIFRNVPGGNPLRSSAVNTTARSTVKVRTVDSVREMERYGGMSALLELMQTYSIKSVSRRGMLNFVNCNMASGHMSQKLTAEQVIGGFDINCTHVAVDLATNRLVWDTAYEEFTRSRQLRISMMHTPWHTFLRLLKKRKELPNVFVDVEAAAQACTGVAHSTCLADMIRYRDVSMRFGAKHQELADSLASDWEPYFRLEEKKVRAANRTAYWSDVPEGAAGAKDDYSLWQLVPRAPLEKPLQTRLDNCNNAVVIYAPRLIDNARLVRPASAVKKLEAIKAQRVLDAKGPVERDFVALCADLFDVAYVQGQALPTVATKVGSWLKKHSSFKRMFFGLTLAQQWAAINELESVCQAYELEDPEVTAIQALGILETQGTDEVFKSREGMLSLLREDTRKGREPMEVTPLPLPSRLPPMFAGFKIRELLTPLALRLEGAEMKHCVGGYASHVRDGHSRILSIRHPGKHRSWNSTMELQGSFKVYEKEPGHLKVRNAQNRIKLNKEPSSENQQLASFLVDYMLVAVEVEQVLQSPVGRVRGQLQKYLQELETDLDRQQREVAALGFRARSTAKKPVETLACLVRTLRTYEAGMKDVPVLTDAVPLPLAA